VNDVHDVLQLHDLDLMLRELEDGADRLRKLGLAADASVPERARARLLARLDRRWISHYERARNRYGRAVARVRDRVCLGCFVTLPTSVTPPPDEQLTVCESCGRILYWY